MFVYQDATEPLDDTFNIHSSSLALNHFKQAEMFTFWVCLYHIFTVYFTKRVLSLVYLQTMREGGASAAAAAVAA